MDLETRSGDRYRAVEITRVENDTLVISHADGTARLPFDELPADLRSKYFDEAKVRAFQQARAKAFAEAEERKTAARQVAEAAAQKEARAAAELKDFQERAAQKAKDDAREIAAADLRDASRKETLRNFFLGFLGISAVLIAARLITRHFSATLAAAGAGIALYFGLIYDTSMPAPYIPGVPSPGRIANLPKMQDRNVGCGIGIAMFLGGIVLYASGIGRRQN